MSSMDDSSKRKSSQVAAPAKIPSFNLVLKGLVVVAKSYGISFDVKAFEQWFNTEGKKLSQYQAIKAAAAELSLNGWVESRSITELSTVQYPALALRKDGKHFIILKIESNGISIVNLSDLKTTEISQEQFFGLYEGSLVLVEKVEAGTVNIDKSSAQIQQPQTHQQASVGTPNQGGAPQPTGQQRGAPTPGKDYALASLATIVEFYGLRLNLEAIKRDLDPENNGLTQENIFTIVERIRGEAQLLHYPANRIEELPLPAIVWQNDGYHYVLLKVEGDQVVIRNLVTAQDEVKERHYFAENYDGNVITVKMPQMEKPKQLSPIQIQQQQEVARTNDNLGQIQQQAFQSVQQLQQKKVDLALRGLVILAKYHGEAVNEEDIQHQFDTEGKGLTKRNWLLAAKYLELKAKVIKQPASRMHLAALPALAWREDGKHFIIAKVDDDNILIQDLASARPMVLTYDQFRDEFYEGEIIVVASRASVMGTLAKFDFTWFIPAIVKYRKILLEVLLISIFIQLFALVTPLFFQVVMDKVLVHRAFTTLDVICIALFVINLFDIILNGLRTFIFAHTTSRIDVELGAKLFRHMLALPIAYFESRRVGETVARVRELEQIRNFLTGQALTSVLDLMFSFIFIIVMLYYSFWLTLVVIISLPCYAFWSAFISPVLRARLNDKFARNADNQSFLVESVTGVNTIKSMAVEPQTTTQWDKLLAAYVYSSFRVTRLANIGQQGVQFIQKMVSLMTLWLGAQLVIKGEMTVGQLIAFNMLSGQVSAPIVRLAQLWQDFQQVGISVARLGDILNTPTENPQSRLALPPIQGDVDFENIVFRYRPDGPEILRMVNLSVKAGEVIGIVGRSGSGKSTLTKLVQRLYVPERGRVLIDGNDLALADPSWLRRQIGVVLQENLLFNRSIKDNIALSDPGMSLERVMDAAKLAGAHEFIMELPEGYDTPVGEQGSTLSGGQRQRIAIARALIGNPRILIFDEATSALDYESERAIMDNMQAICKDRTVLIIAHRLSTVRMSNRIIVMEKGEIIEEGSHDVLLQNPNGHYSYLYQLQNG